MIRKTSEFAPRSPQLIPGEEEKSNGDNKFKTLRNFFSNNGQESIKSDKSSNFTPDNLSNTSNSKNKAEQIFEYHPKITKPVQTKLKSADQPIREGE